jgi:G3E family GTPase
LTVIGPATTQAIPVTIVGGYLGAGKTTLVNHLLRHADGLRLAVLVNEFGALPIDRDLIEGATDTVISITGGCVCCSYGNDLVFALQDVANVVPPIDHILLEASGVGIPGAIAATVGLIGTVGLDGIVVVADAETIREAAADRYMGDTVQTQLREADIVILNKSDLVTEEALVGLRRWLVDAAPRARVVTAIRAAVPLPVVLESYIGRDRAQSDLIAPASAQYESVRLAAAEPVAPEAFALSLIEAGYIRAKGFVRTTSGELATIQVVGRRHEISSAPPRAKPGIVAIRTGDRY